MLIALLISFAPSHQGSISHTWVLTNEETGKVDGYYEDLRGLDRNFPRIKGVRAIVRTHSRPPNHMLRLR